MRRAARIDVNQTALVAELRQVPGMSVYPTHTVGHGFPDIVVGWQKKTYLFEIKATVKDKLTPDEQKFFDDWHGAVARVTTTEDVLRVLGAIPLEPCQDQEP